MRRAACGARLCAMGDGLAELLFSYLTLVQVVGDSDVDTSVLVLKESEK